MEYWIQELYSLILDNEEYSKKQNTKEHSNIADISNLSITKDGLRYAYIKCWGYDNWISVQQFIDLRIKK